MKPIGLIHTPDNWEEIMEWIHRHAPEDRAHLVTAAGMAWNLALKSMETEDVAL